MAEIINHDNVDEETLEKFKDQEFTFQAKGLDQLTVSSNCDPQYLYSMMRSLFKSQVPKSVPMVMFEAILDEAKENPELYQVCSEILNRKLKEQQK
jgi:hypothetical protein